MKTERSKIYFFSIEEKTHFVDNNLLIILLQMLSVPWLRGDITMRSSRWYVSLTKMFMAM